MVDSVVGVFLDKLVDILVVEGSAIIEFQDQFKEMERQLRLMRGFLKDADRLRRKNHTLRAITIDLIELIYTAEDIFALCQARGSGHKDSNDVRGIIFRFQTGKRLREINSKIKQIKNDMTSYLTPALTMHDMAEESNAGMMRWTSPIFNDTQIVGLEDDADKIEGWLFQAHNGLNTIGIVGMGGLGKTTTAQKVFSDREVKDRFNKRTWVSVSQTFTEEGIMWSVLKNLGDACVGDDKGELLEKVHHYLLGSSYLIIMDDVWNLDC